uniref:Pco133868b n=1 Tax=Arundo donax TaxID=35708 RepID=A0A0A9E7G2_ARUDO
MNDSPSLSTESAKYSNESLREANNISFWSSWIKFSCIHKYPKERIQSSNTTSILEIVK